MASQECGWGGVVAAWYLLVFIQPWSELMSIKWNHFVTGFCLWYPRALTSVESYDRIGSGFSGRLLKGSAPFCKIVAYSNLRQGEWVEDCIPMCP